MYYRLPRNVLPYQNQRFFGFGLLPFVAGSVFGLAAAPFFFRPPYPYPYPYPVPYPLPTPYPAPYAAQPSFAPYQQPSYVGTENINIYPNKF
ncbi:hypothetical protein [Bacillus sp. 03113]|uniref:hypothetical protein n=1 Tax=Bacillus sp. 03113 TaxID=2578211 RepID=UPI0015E8B28C|nr:hypothetical protein [Bacillus sp. 03113]